MRLTANTGLGINLVKAYSATEIRVNDSIVRGSCLISADKVIEGWPARVGGAVGVADLRMEDFEPIYELNPEIVLIGTGVIAAAPASAAGQRASVRATWPDRKVIGAVMARGIGVEIMETGAACRTFNILIGEDRRVVAALFL